MTLQWQPDNGAEGYEVHRTKQGPGEEEHLLAYVHPFQTMFADPGLEPATIYAYRVAEVLDAGEVREASTWTVRIQTEPETRFESPQQFFDEYLSKFFSRELTSAGGAKWCMEWWAHFEAAEVVKALWESFEFNRPTTPPEFPNKASADWMVYHGYPLMDRLFGDSSTFRKCSTKDKPHIHNLLSPLPQVINPVP